MLDAFKNYSSNGGSSYIKQNIWRGGRGGDVCIVHIFNGWSVYGIKWSEYDRTRSTRNHMLDIGLCMLIDH